ncbi:hypothetical protein M409DRAFT_30263 [Zasmidium cellare ATCC 36951]|uniref:Uncharacterized protein n=1 Tax=Zasmidium cellare ATCC 36951 TaxID=1080233 RepID=A0A6A6BWV0_ZASCE|nr:uncharacterized protein M409DRAFT_30263 [Zasmidium cellare ATCC 36951]KAF2159257.1 hypothetical protein M409DRAFT_30263 [Zasmidium cellare ATCC 36951]
MTTNSSLTSHGTTQATGWTPSPNVRGTFDIIWTCLQTIALCAWTSICVNLPSQYDGSSEIMRDKFNFLLLNLLSPDLVFLLAYLQLESARASVTRFRADGYHDWTVTHAFYADMGGFAVQAPNWKRFPVNARQLHYLVSKKYIEYPLIPLRDIKAKAKTDGLGRVITIGQIVFFTVTTLGRVVQHLAITTLELTTLGFVLCTVATSICWWYKPNDVEVGHTLTLCTSIDEILRQAGKDADGAYRDTPLDFVAPNRWAGNVIWPYCVNTLRQIGLFPDKHKSRPLQKLSSFSFPKPPSRYTELLVLWLGLAYAAIFFAAWNFYFPTEVECLLWRIFTTMQCVLSAVVGLLQVCRYTLPEKSRKLDAEAANVPHGFFHEVWNKQLNNSISKHPFYNVPLRSLLLTMPLCAAYCICRWYLLLEDIIGLRSVPLSAYQTVDWSRYWPSF